MFNLLLFFFQFGYSGYQTERHSDSNSHKNYLKSQIYATSRDYQNYSQITRNAYNEYIASKNEFNNYKGSKHQELGLKNLVIVLENIYNDHSRRLDSIKQRLDQLIIELRNLN